MAVVIDPMQAGSGGKVAAKLPAEQPEVVMPEIQDVCCVALELSQSKWVCAFAPPAGAQANLHTSNAGDHARPAEWPERQRARAETTAGRSLKFAVCDEAGYDRFWLG